MTTTTPIKFFISSSSQLHIMKKTYMLAKIFLDYGWVWSYDWIHNITHFATSINDPALNFKGVDEADIFIYLMADHISVGSIAEVFYRYGLHKSIIIIALPNAQEYKHFMFQNIPVFESLYDIDEQHQPHISMFTKDRVYYTLERFIQYAVEQSIH